MNDNDAIVPIAPTALAVDSDHYPPETKAKAYELYLTQALSLDDIAVQMGLPRAAVASWSRKGKWVQRKTELESELMRSAEMKFKNWELENRYRVAEQHLKQAEQLQNAVQRVLVDLNAMTTGEHADDKVRKSMDMRIKRLAEALEACANVSARAVGLGVGDGVQRRGMATSQGGKQPLVIINTAPVVPKDSGTQDYIDLPQED